MVKLECRHSSGGLPSAEDRENSFKVLIADDSAIYRKLVEQMLSQDACSVEIAKTGREAIEIYERERPA